MGKTATASVAAAFRGIDIDGVRFSPYFDGAGEAMVSAVHSASGFSGIGHTTNEALWDLAKEIAAEQRRVRKSVETKFVSDPLAAFPDAQEFYLASSRSEVAHASLDCTALARNESRSGTLFRYRTPHTRGSLPLYARACQFCYNKIR